MVSKRNYADGVSPSFKAANSVTEIVKKWVEIFEF